MQEWESLRLAIYRTSSNISRVVINGEIIFNFYDENGDEIKGQVPFILKDYLQELESKGWKYISTYPLLGTMGEIYFFQRPIEE